MILNLTPDQIQGKIDYIKKYSQASNSADGSLVDSNANVDTKNIGILEAELYKPETIQINREIVKQKLDSMFPGLGAQYIKDIESHFIYIHDETSLRPYCASITLFPFLLNGTKPLGGTSKAPKNLHSFCGSFINLVYQVASGFAGAVATVEFLLYFDYFARKTYGSAYITTNKKEVEQALQGVVYALNQPASARGNQSVFWNISVLDKHYFEHLFGTFHFPDGSKAMYYGSFHDLQELFMEWFRKEREKELLTYPVLTASMLIDDEGVPVDTEFAEMCAEKMSKGLSFFVYESQSVDSLASCCRLRNELSDNTFSYTLGAGGVSTGSIQVITLNMNRLVQQKDHTVSDIVKRVHKYLLAHRAVIEDYMNSGLLPAYTAGFINLDKQFLTVGINGMLEASEFLHGKPDIDFYRDTLKTIYLLNKEDGQRYKVKYNTEFVPAENLGVKNAKWDKEDGLVVPRDCYNSYFFPVESSEYSIIDKLDMHGSRTTAFLDGGAACHLNLAQLLTEKQAYQLMCLAGKKGVNYWTFNCLMTICDDCGYIDVNTERQCTKCGSTNVGYATRVIGYLKRIDSFSTARQKEAFKRHYT
ncbi:anaerobic ribonucleoside-triphosphate reductase [Megasphaera sp. AM44-1BH]|uniref:anaerobic ribonucleoside-triphosphate reductase n=1 Tax=Megasphaera sp. AM44-1BH TaxID=2292358 RepID=UPI000E4D08E0|nr:anaerobic ribonucleoside-triphosphate reductase [Megasphaera sp. AM44-1BH]RHA14988.1 anaerobic ribonucleoside-triphosphate reductase [Megasphaera sp. AM44-1BH]